MTYPELALDLAQCFAGEPHVPRILLAQDVGPDAPLHGPARVTLDVRRLRDRGRLQAGR